MKIYIDPGVRACGVAAFASGRLVAAGLVEGSKSSGPNKTSTEGVGGSVGRPVAWTAMASALGAWARLHGYIGHLESLTIEYPQVRDPRHQRAAKKGTNPNDLVQLAAVVGAICDRFRGVPIRAPLPEQWKGTVPKEIHHERALARLDAEEMAIVASIRVAPSRLHNALDAIALGLWDSGRLA